MVLYVSRGRLNLLTYLQLLLLTADVAVHARNQVHSGVGWWSPADSQRNHLEGFCEIEMTVNSGYLRNSLYCHCSVRFYGSRNCRCWAAGQKNHIYRRESVENFG